MDSHIPGLPQASDPVNQLKLDIRAVLHEVTNPLGVVRMATYYLQTANPDDAKRTHYYALIAQSLDRIDGQLKRLRDLLVLSSGAGNPRPDPPDPYEE
jgi:nitrogen-specific signal transduction histidine kinase